MVCFLTGFFARFCGLLPDSLVAGVEPFHGSVSMVKVVINRCFGGFGLSKAAKDALGDVETDWGDEFRCHPKLVEVVEKLGSAANGPYSELVVVDVPDDVDWYIDNYDGVEMVRERHRTWTS